MISPVYRDTAGMYRAGDGPMSLKDSSDLGPNILEAASGLTHQFGVDDALGWCQRFVMFTGTVRIAAIQTTPVILDAEASVSTALRLLGDAANERVKFAVFPEPFIPLYPSSVWAYQAARFDGFDEMWTRVWANSNHRHGKAAGHRGAGPQKQQRH